MAEVRYKGRIALLAVTILIVFTGIGVRLAFLHLQPAEWVREPIEDGRVLEWKPMGNRGRIVDRNGEILAMDLAGNGPEGRLSDGGPDQSDQVKFRDFSDADANDMWTYHAVAAVVRVRKVRVRVLQVSALELVC